MTLDLYRKLLNEHYGQENLCGRIREACEDLGLVPEEMTYEDLADLDHVHIRGLEATLTAGEMMGCQAGDRILDMGSGLGGPARALAAKFGSEVTGLEIVDEFLAAAEMLTGWTGQSEQVSFRKGDMRAMPFPDDAFDAVITQHTLMNVADKAAVFEEVRRVLKPAGGFFLYEICGAEDARLHYPVPWAGGPDISFLVTAEDLRSLITAAGFREHVWTDVGQEALDWFDGLAAGMKVGAPRRRSPNVGVVLGPDAALKSNNLQRNLREGRVRLVQGLFLSS